MRVAHIMAVRNIPDKEICERRVPIHLADQTIALLKHAGWETVWVHSVFFRSVRP